MLRTPNLDLSIIVKDLKTEPLLSENIINIADQMRAIETDQDRVNASKHEQRLTSAVVYLGQTGLEGILILAFLKTVEIKSKIFNSDEFWKKSQLTAHLSEFLCEQLAPTIDKEDAYSCGFLANIGKLVAAFYFPDQADEIQIELNDPKSELTWLQIEGYRDFYDHRTLGEIAAAFWGLPKSVLIAIQGHHTSTPASDKQPTIADIVALANQISHWISLEPNLIDDRLLSNLLEKFNLDEDKMEALVRKFDWVKVESAA